MKVGHQVYKSWVQFSSFIAYLLFWIHRKWLQALNIFVIWITCFNAVWRYEDQFFLAKSKFQKLWFYWISIWWVNGLENCMKWFFFPFFPKNVNLVSRQVKVHPNNKVQKKLSLKFERVCWWGMYETFLKQFANLLTNYGFIFENEE